MGALCSRHRETAERLHLRGYRGRAGIDADAGIGICFTDRCPCSCFSRRHTYTTEMRSVRPSPSADKRPKKHEKEKHEKGAACSVQQWWFGGRADAHRLALPKVYHTMRPVSPTDPPSTAVAAAAAFPSSLPAVETPTSTPTSTNTWTDVPLDDDYVFPEPSGTRRRRHSFPKAKNVFINIREKEEAKDGGLRPFGWETEAEEAVEARARDVHESRQSTPTSARSSTSSTSSTSTSSTSSTSTNSRGSVESVESVESAFSSASTCRIENDQANNMFYTFHIDPRRVEAVYLNYDRVDMGRSKSM